MPIDGPDNEAAVKAGTPSRLAILARYRGPIVTGLTVFLFCMVGLAMFRLTGEVSYADVVANLKNTPPRAILLSLGFTALSFATLVFYDWNAIDHLGKRLPFAQVALTAASAYAVGNAAGFGALSGGAIRYRAYTRLGLSPEEIARVIAFVTLSFGLGVTAVSALAVLAIAEEASTLVGIDVSTLRLGATAVLLALAGLFYLARRKPALKLGRLTIRLADSRTLSRQFLVTVVDLAASASVVYVLLPADTISWPAFFAVYSIAIGLAVVSHVPAGLGVFETIMIAALGKTADIDAVLGPLVLYRLIYYVMPLVIATVVVTLAELRQFADSPVSAELARVATRISAPLIATLALLLGTMMIFSSVTPTPTDNLEFLEAWLPLPVVEGSHFLASLLGLLLVIAARGLSQRLDGAWWAAFAAAAAGLVLSLLKAVALVEAALLAVLLVGLFAGRKLFDRPASLLRQALTGSWLLAVAIICIGAVVILLFVYRDLDYSHELWWQFEFAAEAPRSLRAALGLAIFSSAVAAFSLLRPAVPALARPCETAIADAISIVTGQDVADANLVRTGDKTVMFSTDGKAFIMYRRQGRSWIAFLDPVGPRELHGEMVWQFIEEARAAGCRAVFYQASPDLLPALADAGLQAFKLGELAVVDLAAFDLKGGRWANLRQTAARAERDGLTFELVEPPDVAPLIPDLQSVSDDWLSHHNTREKGFSLGAFTPNYVEAQPVALLRFEGRIVAFANILLTATDAEATVDLMRFSSAAPKSAMDFLFVSLMTEMRKRGVRQFNLGMAPLAGLSRRDVAPVWDRIANTFFEHGERFYNFKGLRAFKGKFHPRWEPRYLAVSGGLSPVFALLDATLLIGGGLKGVVRK